MDTASSLGKRGKEFFLHIGVHKTGTTALQKFLYDNQEKLPTFGLHRVRTGIPEGARGTWGQHELAWTLRTDDKGALWERVANEIPIGLSGIASSEEFSQFTAASIYRPVIAALLETTVRPICYLRRQDQFLESVYNHHVKALGEFGPIMEFAKKIEHRLNYAKVVGSLAKSFGADNVILRTYDQRFLKGDIIGDFMSAVGVTEIGDWERPSRPVNPGLSEEGLRLMLQANRSSVENPRALADARREILQNYSAPSFREHAILSPDERASILEKYREKNDELAKIYLGRKTMF